MRTMRVCDVSFIVIARNEQAALPRCLDSILGMYLENCEVICVDSMSTDRTLAIMEDYRDRHPDTSITVLSPADCRNAAAARNHGLRAATKGTLFLVDGDIALDPAFVCEAIEELKSPDVFAVTGDLAEVIYDDRSGEPIARRDSRYRFRERHLAISCGGSYIAKTEAVHATGLYDERFFRSQDLDFSLRLTRQFPMVALPRPMGVHHTRQHRDRPWLHLVKGHILNQGMLARKHWKRPGFLTKWYASRKSFVWGFVAVNVLLVAGLLSLLGAMPWLPTIGLGMALLLFEGIYSVAKRQPILSVLIKHVLSPYAVFLGFCLEPHLGRPARKAQRRPY